MLFMQTRNMFIFLISRSPKYSEENIATIIGESSEKFINQNKLCNLHFAWQETASAFSVSKADIDKVCKYILNQPEHHRVSFPKIRPFKIRDYTLT
jgi:putative transposase